MSLEYVISLNYDTKRESRKSKLIFEETELESGKKENYLKDINFIINAFYSMFCVLSTTSKSKVYDCIGRSLEYGTTITLSFVIIADLYAIYTIIHIIPMGLTFSTFITDFCGFSLRLLILYKKKAMIRAITVIYEFYSVVEENISTRRVKLLFAFIACFIIPATEFVYSLISCINGEEFYLKDLFLGWTYLDNNIACLVALFIEAISLSQRLALPGFGVVLCCYVFGVIRRFVDKFTTMLQQKDGIEDVFLCYTKYSRIIYSCIKSIEDSFSILVAFLYGFMTFSIFNVTTFLIRIDYKRAYLIDLIPFIVEIIFVISAFFIMSLRAISLNDAAVSTKQNIYDIVARTEASHNQYRNLLLIMVTDFPNRVVVTGWGLFTLKRSFIQGTAGAMITYSILLSQLGR